MRRTTRLLARIPASIPAIPAVPAVPAVLAVLALLAALPGCSPSFHSGRADRDAEKILGPALPQFDRERRSSVRRPEPAAPVDAEASGTGAAQEAAAGSEELLTLTLNDALEIALETNRSQISRKESLFLSALSLAGTRHRFSPQLSAVCNYLFSNGSDRSGSHGLNLGFSASQILPSGGSISFNADTSVSQDDSPGLSDPRSYSSSLGVSLNRPLLRGAGREIASEALIQAERNLIYDIRDYEMFRQDFSIGVADQYYRLVEQMKSIQNQQLNLDKVDYTYRLAKAFFEIGKKTESDVLRARENLLTAENEKIIAEEGFELALDNFRIFLGLPPGVRVEVVPTEPEFIPVDYDVDSAIEVALANRLDFITQKDRLEDAARSLRIAENSLLPDLNLNLGYNLSSNAESTFTDQNLDNSSYSAGLSLEIPIDQVDERHSFRRAQISFAAQQRSFDEIRDQLVVGVVSSLRELKRRKLSLEIQEQRIEDAERSVRIAVLQLDRGDIDNRTLLDSQKAELDARNALISEKVGYENARLNLLKDLGILFIDEKGMWTE